MNRFHRSFLGLMEMCNSGEWVKAEEAQQIIDSKDEQIVLYDEDNSRLKEENERLLTELTAHKNGYLSLTFRHNNLMAKEAFKHRLSVALGAISFILIIDLIVRIVH
jgi:hypothetical protein